MMSPAGRSSPDHPRACGELGSNPMDISVRTGSSPRMRGTRLGRKKPFRFVRIIPAHAGNSGYDSASSNSPPDHPRACGELGGHRRHRVARPGSSPRMRGTRAPPGQPQPPPRIIPAHAGNSLVRLVMLNLLADHPRACGELDSKPLNLCKSVGSSPRMRGTPAAAVGIVWGIRIIPAHAGNSLAPLRTDRTGSDHPRACGELRRLWTRVRGTYGSSPRMRGTHVEARGVFGVGRIIPAHAGNSIQGFGERSCGSDHPRACGELLLSRCPVAHLIGSSPRMRGTRSRPRGVLAPWRIIPAHAGNSGDSSDRGLASADHPRACGELVRLMHWVFALLGSSPRMRGTQKGSVDEVAFTRIIPAHAGNSPGAA